MNAKQKKMLYRILAAAALLVVIALLPRTGLLALAPVPVVLLYLIPYLVVGWDVLRKAALGVKNRQPFDECFLMAVATVGAFALGEYAEGCAVMLFYQIGELFQAVAVGKSRRSIATWSSPTAPLNRSTPTRWRWARSSWWSRASGCPSTAWCWKGSRP